MTNIIQQSSKQTNKPSKSSKVSKSAAKEQPQSESNAAMTALEAAVAAQAKEIEALKALLTAPKAPEPQTLIVKVEGPGKVAVSPSDSRVIRRDGTSARKESVLQSAPKTRENVNPIGGNSAAEVQSVLLDGVPHLKLFTPKFSHKFHKGFLYHQVKQAGKNWNTRKEGGKWFQYIPMGDRDLMLKGLADGFPGGVVNLDGNTIRLPE